MRAKMGNRYQRGPESSNDFSRCHTREGARRVQVAGRGNSRMEGILIWGNGPWTPCHQSAPRQFVLSQVPYRCALRLERPREGGAKSPGIRGSGLPSPTKGKNGTYLSPASDMVKRSGSCRGGSVQGFEVDKTLRKWDVGGRGEDVLLLYRRTRELVQAPSKLTVGLRLAICWWKAGTPRRRWRGGQVVGIGYDEDP